MKHIIAGFIMLVCGVVNFICHEQPMSPGSVSPAEVRAIVDRQDTTYIIVDVRTRAEFESETGHIPGAKLIPLDELERRSSELLPSKMKEIIVYCRSGRRSAEAAQFLAGKGFHVMNMEGGILQWNDMEKK